MNTLLIGGTNDGKRVSVPDTHDHLRLPCKSEHEGFIYQPTLEAMSCVQTEIYTLQRLRGGTTTFDVFAIQGMTGDQIIEKLIQCYSPCQP